MSITRSDIFPILALVAIAYCLVFQLWITFRRRPKEGERRPCSQRMARLYARELQKIAREERIRAWQDSGLGSQQAAWLCAKAEYALHASGYNKNSKNISDKGCFLLEDMHSMLLVSCEQSRLGCRTIQEEAGARLRAYISDIDDSLQTYSVSVPKGYDDSRPWPLLVSMHGHGWFRPFQGHPAPAYRGAICLSPQGRGATDYKGLGELDVLQAIEEVKKHFNIDVNRIYLTGHSMGGTGAFHLGTHYADLFAGILPVSGNADYLAWTHAWGWNRVFPGRNTAMRTWVQESHCARAYAQNLMTLPTFIISGTGDIVVPPEHSRNMAKLLRKYNAPVQYREYLDAEHGGFPTFLLQQGLSWVTSYERNPYPRNIYWKADSLRYGKAYWTRMEQFAQPVTSAYLHTSLRKEDLVFQTSNLLSFSFQRPAELFQPADSMTLTIDKQEIHLQNLPRDPEAWITLRKDPIHGWRDARDLPQPGLIKKAGLEGPISAALEQPFVLVVGTSALDDSMNQAWKREAQTFQEEWKRRNGAPCRLVTDKECTPDIMKQYNLILFGDGRDNSVSDLIAKSLPVSDMLSNLPIKNQDPQEIQSSPLDAPDLGYMLVYPNCEFSPDRLVVMLSANSQKGAYQMWGRFGNWFNWGVFDSRKYFDYACFDARSATPESMLLIGWFGTDWRVESGTFHLGNEEIRSEMPKQEYPAYTETPDNSEPFMLADLIPTRIDQMRGALGIGRGFFGENLMVPASLGMRAPCTLDYEISPSYKKFSSDIALINSPETNMCHLREIAEQVTFRVYGDGKLLVEKKLTWDKPRLHLETPLHGVSKLRLEAVCTKGPSWLHSGSAWLGPTLWKKP